MVTPGQFQVSESGAATYTIPIQVSPGVGGMEPKLSLNYSSQAGNDLLGVGWNLGGLGAVSRCSRTVAQDGVRGKVNYDSNDRYCLDGQRLIAISGSEGGDGTEYRTERESFARVVSYGSAGNGPAWFKVWTKAGQVMEYGKTTDARIEAQGKPTIRVWALNRIEDTKGNYLAASYTKDAANGDYYPDRIDYTGNSKTNAVPPNSVQFIYEARPDVVNTFFNGSLIKRSVRLKSLSVNVASTKTASYELTYDIEPVYKRSKVTAVKQCAEAKCNSPIELTYFSVSPAWEVSGTWEPPYPLFSRGLDGEGVQFVDVNGDGLVDIVRSLWVDGTIYKTAWLNTGSGWKEAPEWAPPYPLWSRGLGSEGVQFVDVNGDGLVDIVRSLWVNGTIYKSAWLNTGSGWKEAPEWEPPYPLWSRGYDNEGMAFVDVNGDGLVDIVRSLWVDGTIYKKAWLNTGSGWKEAPEWEPPAPLWSRGLDNEGMQFVDVNGDGLVDIIRSIAADGKIYKKAWLNTGSGWKEAPEWEPPYPLFSRGLDNEGIAVVDINGDGLPDIVRNLYVNGTIYKTAWLNTGSGWQEAPEWAPPYPLFNRGLDEEGVELVDVNGDGLVDVVRHLSVNGTSYKTAWIRPSNNLSLKTISNATSLIMVTYGLSSNPALNVPDTSTVANTTNSRGIGLIVSSVSSSNGIGGTTSTSYTYGGLKSDLSGRGLLGFRWMQTRQVETGLTSYTEYQQSWPYTGLPSLVKKSLAGGGNNGVLSQITNSYNCNDAASTTVTPCVVGAGKRYFVYANQSVESGWDYNGAVLPVITTKTEYDTWGNATRVDVSTSDGYGKSTINSYSNDSNNWYLGRLLKSSVTSATP